MFTGNHVFKADRQTGLTDNKNCKTFSSQAIKQEIFSLKCIILVQLVYIVVTNNLHGIMFSSLTVKQKYCCALVTDDIHYKTFSSWATEQKIILLKQLIIAVTTICVESCFQAWSSNKNISDALSLTDNIHWIMFSSPATK